jgi:phage/plasmid-associated DNA primase
VRTDGHDDVPAPRKVAKFMVDCVEAAPRSRVESAELYVAYQEWCEDNRVRALPAPQFADALVPVLNEVGIARKTRGDDVFLVGVRLAG